MELGTKFFVPDNSGPLCTAKGFCALERKSPSIAVYTVTEWPLRIRRSISPSSSETERLAVYGLWSALRNSAYTASKPDSEVTARISPQVRLGLGLVRIRVVTEPNCQTLTKFNPYRS